MLEKGIHPFNALLLLAKYPVPGTVKTRLAHGTAGNGYQGLEHLPDESGNPVGKAAADQIAADLYRAILTDRFEAHSGQTYKLYLGISQLEHQEEFLRITGPDTAYCPAEGANLGEMMHNIFARLLSSHDCVVISGSDIPYIPEGLVQEVFSNLDDHDVVLVPAMDGAYNMIGMRKLHDVFGIARWSSGSELVETINLMTTKGISHKVLSDRPIMDVDILDDLKSVSATLLPGQAPRTTALLDTMQYLLKSID